MKRKMIFAGIAAVLVIAFILGCVTGYRFPDTAQNHETERDRLVGMYLTKEYLDTEPDINDMRVISDIEQDFSRPDQNAKRYYARRTDDGTSSDNITFIFDVPGYPFFSVKITDENGRFSTLITDDAISDIHQHLNTIEGEESISLEGNVYIIPGGKTGVLYLNPVYQTPEGEIYMVAGSGLMVGDSLITGSSISQEINESYTETAKNGAGTATTSLSRGSSCKITFLPLEVSELVTVIAFNEKHEKLEEKQYKPEEMPDELSFSKETAYIFSEESTTSGTRRQLNERGENEYIRTFSEREDGMMIPKDTWIQWE